MISKNTIKYLSDLKKNNYKEWFDSNKSRYEEAKKEFEQFITSLIPLIAKFDKDIAGVTSKECLFRIYRDVRFSKDKTPYKTHLGAYIATCGRKSPFGGYYVHIEPGASFLAGGIYMPEPRILKAVREEIVENTEAFNKIISEKNYKSKFGELWGESLKTIPKGFPKDFKYPDLLKLKSYCPLVNLKDAEVLNPGYPDFVIESFKQMYPLNKFLNKIIHFALEENS